MNQGRCENEVVKSGIDERAQMRAYLAPRELGRTRHGRVEFLWRRLAGLTLKVPEYRQMSHQKHDF
jgi:hypothetical protein